MVYGAEAVLPTDLQYGSPKVRAYQPDAAEKDRRDVMDLLEESRDIVVIRSTGYQQALRWYHAQGLSPGFPGRRFGFMTDTNQERYGQDVPALGGTLLGR
jgi:hypothetical protein